jgi:hypothetical protein
MFVQEHGATGAQSGRRGQIPSGRVVLVHGHAWNGLRLLMGVVLGKLGEGSTFCFTLPIDVAL